MSLQLDVQTSNEWHVLKGETQFGPYAYTDMIQMLQNKMLFGFDYTWSPHLETWTTLSELPEFSADRLSRLAEKSEGNVFNKRSTDRVAIQLPVYCHDHSKFWNGTCENLSAGGALILMENPVLIPGNLVSIHFRAVSPEDVAFNCTAEILTKRLTKQRIQHDTEIHYAVKFVQTLPAGDKQLKKWVSQQLKDSRKRS